VMHGYRLCRQTASDNASVITRSDECVEAQSIILLPISPLKYPSKLNSREYTHTSPKPGA
jgi:hypothetical protein